MIAPPSTTCLPAPRWFSLLPVAAALLCALPSTATPPPSPSPSPTDSPVRFNRDIRPLLSDHCFACHGPDTAKVKARLRLDVRDLALAPARSGLAAIVPGQPEKSELIARITTDNADDLMPPAETHKVLTPEQKELFRRWIADGAPYETHWSYTPPVRPPAPSGPSAIDHLIGQRLQVLGLKPAPPADRRTLVRRLYSDLLGLPPQPDEVSAFENDPRPDAYPRLVERLLASPHFGERMALGWLDVVRFADTIGYHSDNPRNIWPYRDYVIQAFNRNQPFDQFTREQLAGDLLPHPTRDQLVASGFNRLLLTTEEGGAQPKDYEARYLTDRVRAVGTVWLGQTIGCAQCHDHKFDPITARDFYSLGAFFADIQEPIIGRREDGLLLVEPEVAARLDHLNSEVARLEKALEGTKPESDSPEQADLRKQLTETRHARDAFSAPLPRSLVSQRLDTPRMVRILARGNFLDETGEVVAPALPEYLAGPGPGPNDPRLTRLDLANWLVSRDHPLTARVVMNRLWKQFFGSGLSKVLDDFGAQGEPPRNPELLDWLATEFMDRDWDFKHMVRTLVLSETYRQSSTAPRDALEQDPDNREFARQGRWRIDAELVRDAALSYAGLLVPTLGGPSVKPYQPEGYWENLNFPPRTYPASTGPDQYRRGLYVWWQRSFLHPSLAAFDAPSREECTAERNRSNIPQQALVLLNDPSYVEAARALATRVLTEAVPSTPDRLRWAWQQVLTRQPDPTELAALRQLLEKHTREFTDDPAAALAFLQVGQQPPPPHLNPSELAAWTNLARVLLNLHETITRS